MSDFGYVAVLVQLHVDIGATAASHHMSGDAFEVLDEAGDAGAVGVGQVAVEEAFLLLAAPILDDRRRTAPAG